MKLLPRTWGAAFVPRTILFFFLATLTITCTEKKPDIEECRVALANFLRIQLGDSTTPTEINQLVLNDPISKKMVQLCISKKTVKQVRCEMSAIDQADILKCTKWARPDPTSSKP